MTNDQIQTEIAKLMGKELPECLCDECLILHNLNYPTSLDACREFENNASVEYWQILFESTAKQSKNEIFSRTWINIKHLCMAETL